MESMYLGTFTRGSNKEHIAKPFLRKTKSNMCIKYLGN